jgi:hypothetical protein
MSEIEDEFKNLQELMVKITELYKEYANIPKKQGASFWIGMPQFLKVPFFYIRRLKHHQKF